MKKSLLALLALVSFHAQAEEAMVIDVKRMTLETALTAAQATVEACRKKGIQVGVTVVDRTGQRQVFLRDVLAPEITDRVSFKKAFTAVSFTAATSALTRQGNSALAHVEDMFFGAGGVLIQAGGKTLGAIGVSGAPGGEIDEECANAGVEAVKDDLEMSM